LIKAKSGLVLLAPLSSSIVANVETDYIGEYTDTPVNFRGDVPEGFTGTEK